MLMAHIIAEEENVIPDPVSIGRVMLKDDQKFAILQLLPLMNRCLHDTPSPTATLNELMSTIDRLFVTVTSRDKSSMKAASSAIKHISYGKSWLLVKSHQT